VALLKPRLRHSFLIGNPDSACLMKLMICTFGASAFSHLRHFPGVTDFSQLRRYGWVGAGHGNEGRELHGTKPCTGGYMNDSTHQIKSPVLRFL
jgi:hypothetical protein